MLENQTARQGPFSSDHLSMHVGSMLPGSPLNSNGLQHSHQLDWKTESLRGFFTVQLCCQAMAEPGIQPRLAQL